MNEYLLLMHDGTTGDRAAWGPYLAKLRDGGYFLGGSSIGGGECVTKSGTAPEVTPRLAGYVKIRARDIGQARELLAGNPVYEAGGVVEIRELPEE